MLNDSIKIFIDLINSESRDDVFKTLEKIYIELEHKKKRLKNMEEYKIAYDLLQIKDMLYTSPYSLLNIEIKSTTINNNKIYQDCKNIKELDDGNISVINTKLIQKYDYFISAIFLLELIQKNKRKEQKRYIIATVVSIIGASAAISVLLIKEFFL